MHVNMGVFNFLNKMADMRCNLLSYHLFLWHLTYMFAPEEVKLCVFELFKVRGGALMQAFCCPDGKVSTDRIMKNHKENVIRVFAPYL